MKIMDKLRTNRSVVAASLAAGLLVSAACQPETGKAGESGVKAHRWPARVVHEVVVNDDAGAYNKNHLGDLHELKCRFVARKAGNTIMFMSMIDNQDPSADGLTPKGVWAEYALTRNKVVRQPDDERPKSKNLEATFFWTDPDGQDENFGSGEIDLNLRYPMGAEDVFTLPCGQTDILDAKRVFNWPFGSQQKYVMSDNVPQP